LIPIVRSAFPGNTDYPTAGVEPPGLQVFGSLPVATWEDWDQAFPERIVGWKVRKLR
jgi:hypothetical protein